MLYNLPILQVLHRAPTCVNRIYVTISYMLFNLPIFQVLARAPTCVNRIYVTISYIRFNLPIFQVRVWLMSIGFTSLFGAMFSKTYRVYVVFRDHSLKSKVSQVYQMTWEVNTQYSYVLLLRLLKYGEHNCVKSHNWIFLLNRYVCNHKAK